MPKPDLFFDSSALFAGVVSSKGAARALLLLAEGELVTLTVSEQVVTETEHAIARKVLDALPYYREALRSTGLRIVPDPSADQVEAHQGIIKHQTDVPIIVAAMKADVDYLTTFNRRHFIDDPEVAEKSGLRIGAPGEVLAWVRDRLVQDG